MSDGTQWIPTENLAASVLTGTRNSYIITGKRSCLLIQLTILNTLDTMEYGYDCAQLKLLSRRRSSGMSWDERRSSMMSDERDEKVT